MGGGHVVPSASPRSCAAQLAQLSICTSALLFGCASALQVTALGNPDLLKQLSRTLAEVKRLFSRFDKTNDGYIHKEEFFEVRSAVMFACASIASLVVLGYSCV